MKRGAPIKKKGERGGRPWSKPSSLAIKTIARLLGKRPKSGGNAKETGQLTRGASSSE